MLKTPQIWTRLVLCSWLQRYPYFTHRFQFFICLFVGYLSVQSHYVGMVLPVVKLEKGGVPIYF